MSTVADPHPNVSMSISIGGSIVGALTFSLCDADLPLTCANFRSLSQSSYPKTKIHRIIPTFMFQTGDYQNQNGTGGNSIYSGKFNDEKFNIISHDKPGILSMANSGPNTNGSQFFVTFASCPHLNGKHVSFGRLISGWDVLEKIKNVEVDGRDCPVMLETVRIEECWEGERKRGREEESDDGSSSKKKKSKKGKKAKNEKREKKKKSKKDKKEKVRMRINSVHCLLFVF